MIKPYLKDIINNNKTQFREWKIRLTTIINFISLKDSEETYTMHTRSANMKIMMGTETNNIIKELCKSLQKYQERLEESMRKSKFVF